MPRIGTGDSLIGRAAELDQLRAFLQASKDGSFPAVIRVLGSGGIGKSAVLRALLSEARASGWLPMAVECHSAYRRRPLAVLTQGVRTLLRSLGDQAYRYASGLEGPLSSIDPAFRAAGAHRDVPLELAPAQFETLFLRLLQGVLNDHPIVLALDDVAWADQESIRIVDYVSASVAGFPFVVVVTGRLDDVTTFSPSLPAITVSLRPLNTIDATELVRASFSPAPEDVARAIVTYARGIPLDLVTLAVNAAAEQIETAEGVHDGVRAVVSSDLRKMSPDLRRLLQLCSVVSEPVPLQLLVDASGEPEDAVLAVLGRDDDRYVTLEAAELRFRHRLIGDAVRSTIEDRFSLLRRVLAALLSIANPTIEDCQRIADLAAECGERELRREYVMRLADNAYRSLQFQSAAGYYRAASSIRPPHPSGYVEFYRRFTTALRANDYDVEAAQILGNALRDGEDLGISPGLGVLAAALVLTLCNLDDFDRAAQLYEYYYSRLKGSEDRSELLASAAIMFADTMQIKPLEEALGRAADLPRKTNYANAKLEYARASAESRLGAHESACRALKSAAFYAELDRSLMSYNIPFDQLLIDFRHYGNAALRERLPDLARQVSAETGTHAFATYLAAFSDFLDGAWEHALARLAEINLTRFAPALRARLMSVPAAIEAFSLQPSVYAAAVRADVDVLVREVHEGSAVQLGSWWIAFAAIADRAQSQPVALKLWRWSEKSPLFNSISFMPVSFALYAERIGDRTILRELADRGGTLDVSPWMQANTLLARGVALSALGDRGCALLLRDSSARFSMLGAPFFAAYAATRAGTASAAEDALLRSLGVITANGAPTSVRAARRRSGPTVRELEIARLVADGQSNRKIATQLFLSERTVEVHIANLFGKLAITSRTQLVRWALENDVVRA